MNFKQCFFRIYDKKIASGEITFSRTGISKDQFTALCTEPAFVFDDALLAKLKAAGVKLGVFSNKADGFSREMVAHYFPGVFDVVRGKAEGCPVKPDPAGTMLVLQALEADPARTIFVGDSGVDIRTGHNADLPACGVSWGFRPRQTLVDAGADFMADTVEELERVLLGG